MSFKVFKSAAKAKPTSNYGQRIPKGSHRVLLNTLKVRESKNDDSPIGTEFVASQFVVDEPDEAAKDLKKNEIREWPFFTDAPSWQGKYALASFQQLGKAILGSIDLAELPRNDAGEVISPVTGKTYLDDDTGKPKTEHDVATVLELATENFFRGIRIAAVVEDSYNKKTKKLNTNAEGEPYTDVTWKAVPGQTIATIAKNRETVDKVDPPTAESAFPEIKAGPKPPTPSAKSPGIAGMAGLKKSS